MTSSDDLRPRQRGGGRTRTRASASASGKSKRTWAWIVILTALAFLAGRWSGSGVPSDPLSSSSDVASVGALPDPEREESLAFGTGTGTGTGVAMCPCPAPEPVGIKRKPTPPLATPPFEAPDPTAETARFLRARARALGDCAPKTGGEVRVHLEVKVQPAGTIDRVSVTNVEGVPSPVSQCVERLMKAEVAPPFDASEAATFALSVVL